jgi:hypothetical protein
MDYSQITDSLFIGTTPRSHDYQALQEMDVRLVINMRLERRPYACLLEAPVPALWLPTIDSPLFPIPIRQLFKGAQAATQVIAQGGRVYTHCAKGIHRGVAMGAAVLIALGYPFEEAISTILERRQVADPNAWYIRRRIIHFSKFWENAQRVELPAF